MNLIDAVRALKEGKCERIELDGLTLRFVDNVWINGGGYIITIKPEYVLSDEWELVNPIKEFEEVEVVKWFWIDNEGVEHYATEKPFGAYSNLAIKLTGTIKKEIKHKVNKREEVEQLFLGNMAGPLSAPYRYKGRNVQLFAEWEE